MFGHLNYRYVGIRGFQKGKLDREKEAVVFDELPGLYYAEIEDRFPVLPGMVKTEIVIAVALYRLDIDRCCIEAASTLLSNSFTLFYLFVS
jgi:hypothetical protein